MTQKGFAITREIMDAKSNPITIYVAALSTDFVWTNDPDLALGFAREVDAINFYAGLRYLSDYTQFPENKEVVEHTWEPVSNGESESTEN